MVSTRLLKSALAHLDRDDRLPLVFRGIKPEEAEKLFDGIARRRPGILDLPLKPGDGPAIRQGLLALFSADGHPDSFQNTWNAFTVSLGIRGGGCGMELAAGLQTRRDGIYSFLRGGMNEGTTETVCRVLDAVARHLPSMMTMVDLKHLDPFTERILRELADRDTLRCPPLLAGVASGRIPFKARIVELGKERQTREPLEELTPALRETACAAAVLGLVFRPVEAAAIAGNAGCEPERLLETGIFKRTASGDFCFPSPELRARFLDSLSAADSTELHEKAAEVVMARNDSTPESLRLAGDLLLRAGDETAPGRAYLRAAMKSDGIHHRKAARLWALARDHHPRKPMEMLFKRSERLYMGGYMEEALENAARAARGAEAGPMLLMLEIFVHTGDDPRAESLLRRLEAEASAGGLPREEELELRILSLLFRGRNMSMEEIDRCIISLDAEPLTPGQKCRLLLCRARALARHGLLSDALLADKEAMDWAEANGLAHLRESAMIQRISCLRKAGLLDDAQEGCEELQKAAAGSGNLEALKYALNTRGGIASCRGCYEQASDCYAAVAVLSEKTGNRRLKTTALVNLGVTRMMTGRYDEAVDNFMTAIRMASEVGDTLRLAGAYGNLARIFLDRDMPENAQDCVDTMLEAVRESGPAQMLESAVYLRARVLDLKGECAPALRCLEEALEMARRAGRTRNVGLYLVLKGLFLMNHGRIGEAAESLAFARVRCEETVKPPNNSDAALAGETACLVMLGKEPPERLLEILPNAKSRGVTGTIYYWHWKTAGDPGSAVAAREYLAPAPGENNAYRAYQMLREIEHCFYGQYIPG